MANFTPLSRDVTGTVRRKGPEITLTPREKQVYGTLWQAADVDGNGFITGADAVPFFAKSGLSPQILGQIWVLADADNKGVLNQQGFSIAVKLIAHAQTGKTPASNLIHVDAPLPRFEGLTGTASDSPLAAASGPGSSPGNSVDPPISPEDKTKYGSMFLSCGPVGGLLDGEKAREVFLKSKLPVEKLGQIWNLADTKQRGSLDLTDFTIAMYYIQHTMNGSIKTLPATLPPPVLKACGPAGPGMLASPVLSTQALPRQSTGGGVSGHLPRQMTGSFGLSANPLPKQLTGGQVPSSSSAFGLGASSSSLPSLDTTWDISPEEKAKFDRFFDQLDKTGSGALGGEEASKFFMNSRLPETVLAQIWDLADITKSGSLSKDEFAVAMYLINRKNATNAPIPSVLPPTLIPPSLRTRSMLTSGFSDSLRGMSTPASSHNRRQSFDLLGDGPVAAHTTGPSAADKETDELQSKMTAATGELASLQNQLNNMSQTTGDLQGKRRMLEQQLSSLSGQKHEISIRLNNIKTLHESETKTIKDLQATIASLEPQLVQLRDELAKSQHELLVARNSKDEYLLSVARDKEESEQIKTKLKQNQEETVRLRQELEAMKKDTTRQKNLLEISRRQLAASEAEKQRLKDEIEGGLAHSRQGSFSSASSSPAVAPPPPAPRGSRKEPPPPPASRGANYAKPSPEMEEAFGIPQALRSPTGSFHEVPKAAAAGSIASLSRQSTGTSPFETLSRQTTGTSPFEQIARQDTGKSGKAGSIRSNHGGTGAASHQNFLEPGGVDAGDLWSPSTHAAHNAAAGGGFELTKSPEPLDAASAGSEGSQMLPPSLTSVAAAAAAAPLSSQAVSDDPFGAMAFPAMDTGAAVTKVDFDAAFQGFSTSMGGAGLKSAGTDGLEESGVKSAEAFAEAFPELEPVTTPSPLGAAGAAAGTTGSANKRVSAFGFDDDFSLPDGSMEVSTTTTTTVPTSKRTIKEEEDDDEFPPIVQMEPRDESDSSDDEEDDDDEFVQARSHIPTPEVAAGAGAGAAAGAAAAAAAAAAGEGLEQTPAKSTATQGALAAPVPTSSSSSSNPISHKLTAADFEEFETKLGGSDVFGAAGDDFDSAFSGVALSSAAKSGATGGVGAGGPSAKNAFEDSGFDFTMSFDDAFGPSTSNAATTLGGASAGAPAKPIDLDEVFGGAFGNSSASTTNATAAVPSTGAGGLDGFDDGFGSTAPSGVNPKGSSDAVAPAAAAATTTTTTAAAATPAVAAPAVTDLQGVDELMSLGFTRQQANDALSRYDTVERAANFLLEGGAN